MTPSIQMDEFHLTIYAPRGLPEAEYEAIVRVLDSRPFRAQLRRAVRAVVRRHAPLRAVRVRVSR